MAKHDASDYRGLAEMSSDMAALDEERGDLEHRWLELADEREAEENDPS